MAKAEFGTPKFLSNQMKARGLQKLKWYCQVCEKQCRDDNGFKCHIRSESHLKKIKDINPSAISEYSKRFQDYFISTLHNYHGTKKINANRFYNQVIQQREHVHMNSTKWSSLTQFLRDIQQQGLIDITVNENNTEDGLEGVDISYINNSSDEILRKTHLKRKEETTKTDEQLRMKLLEDQIIRGKELNEDDVVEDEEPRTPREGPIKIQLNGGLKKRDLTTPKKLNAFKVAKPTLKQPFKSSNVFKKST